MHIYITFLLFGQNFFLNLCKLRMTTVSTILEQKSFKALQLDTEALMFVCNRVDPDYIGNGDPPLSQATILCIMNQLGDKLEGETELKLRYCI